jgi:uncharacterized protein
MKEARMRKPGTWLRSAAAAAVLLLGACVTINIYFPAEKVESVAGEIVQDIRGVRPEKEPETAPDKKSSSRARSVLLASLVGAAWADDVTTVSNPAIRTLKQRMKERYPQMKPHFQSGVLAEGADGFVTAANPGALGLKERRDLTGLVEAENKDRRALYQEVAKALNIDPSQTGQVAAIFAKEWQKSLN